MFEKISRRKFVATAGVAGASAAIGGPGFSFADQSPGASVATGAIQ